MKINFNDPNPGQWFDLDADTAICLRIANTKFLRSIEKLPKEQQEQKTWDYCIVGWRNLLDEDGNEIPCTRENKIKLIAESMDFMLVVNHFLEKINEDLRLRKEDLEKNSLAT